MNTKLQVEGAGGSENGRAMVGHALASKSSATAMEIEMRGIREIVADLSKPAHPVT